MRPGARAEVMPRVDDDKVRSGDVELAESGLAARDQAGSTTTCAPGEGLEFDHVREPRMLSS